MTRLLVAMALALILVLWARRGLTVHWSVQFAMWLFAVGVLLVAQVVEPLPKA